MAGTNTKERVRPRIKETIKQRDQVETPKNYRVVLLNNPVTDFDAVVDVLRSVFQKAMGEANQIMMYAHMNGRALVMTSTREICNQKVEEARNYCLARANDSRGGRNMYYDQLVFEVEEDDENNN